MIEIPDVIDVQGKEATDQSTNYDMSELLSGVNNESIENYMQFDGLVENSDLVNTEEKDELILEAEIQDAAKDVDTETLVTNGFLQEGAILISDASPENVPQQIELDSNDHI